MFFVSERFQAVRRGAAFGCLAVALATIGCDSAPSAPGPPAGGPSRRDEVNKQQQNPIGVSKTETPKKGR